MATRKTAPKKTTKTSKAKAAPKKTTAAKKPLKKTVKKAVKKTSPKKKKEMAVGTSFECPVCGLEVSVEKVCDCADACEIICCGEPMERI
jgi:transcription elongation factor Elf1